MGHFIDLTGQRFGRLLVMERAKTVAKNGNLCWLCHCDCGKHVVVEGYALRSGVTRSCGCLRRDVSRRNAKCNQRFIAAQGSKLVDENGIGFSSFIKSKRNQSGVIGVSFDKKSGHYVARLMYHGHYVLNHTTETFEEAVALRKQAEQHYFKHIDEQ
ncbi:hypothetical protein FD04_GL002450 [Secundilactobacillus odoratitofui DSM 19909 = JCM 15043]|uniref:Uncharacterized protein n=1 Tax=Secundilactobacillus odoratitofui DSM 19909 = JCM 15043 TaxID=1423776 RepID=A0A0R1M5F4_9LACO|nr:hypothetical protein [Secundilactobacillus odoratitofui]KRK99674.1 hypothetical protein FD04_GL002450 [Secundilactobacillus odoratitofui DSM 19909 = JCM 15043]